MEDKSVTPEAPKTMELTKEEQLKWHYDQRVRAIRISSARSHVVKSEITEAYRILERIRFDYLGDTAFRDKITNAKKNLEYALQDFLLSDTYWEQSRERIRNLTPEQYEASLYAVPGLKNESTIGV